MALVDDYIAEISSMPKGSEDEAGVRDRLFASFNEEINLNVKFDMDNKNWPAIVAWLKGIKDRRERDVALAEAAAPKQHIEQSVMVDVSLAMNQAYTALDSLDLPEDEVRDAKLALAEAQNEPNPEKRSEKAFEVVKWGRGERVENC